MSHPAQFSLRSLLWLTAAVGFLCLLARVFTPESLLFLLIPAAYLSAPCLIVGAANYGLFFLAFEHRMFAANAGLALLALLTVLVGILGGCVGVLVAAFLVVSWLPQIILCWEWIEKHSK